MITVQVPRGREFAALLLDAVLRKQVTYAGVTVRFGMSVVPEIDLIQAGNDAKASVFWKSSPIAEHSEQGISGAVGQLVVRDRPGRELLFAALRHEWVRIAPAIGLVFTGRVMPETQVLPGADGVNTGVRLTWANTVRVDVTGLPTFAEPSVERIDVYADRAIVVLGGFPDVTLELQ